jgi:hypothetical protein
LRRTPARPRARDDERRRLRIGHYFRFARRPAMNFRAAAEPLTSFFRLDDFRRMDPLPSLRAIALAPFDRFAFFARFLRRLRVALPPVSAARDALVI